MAVHPMTLPQLRDIAVGLCYRTYPLHGCDRDGLLSRPLVHSQGVIHGDLHSVGLIANVTFDKDR